MKKASIVIINHNYGAYAAQAINSALAQTWPELEVVVVDDGSSDNSREEITKYGSRIFPIFQDQVGHTGAVNTGFAASTGRFVLFLDADDLLYPTAIATSMALLRPGDSKIQFQLATIDQHGIDLNFPFPYFPPGFSQEQARAQALTTGWYPWTTSSGNLYSREYLEGIFPLDTKRIFRSPDSILNKLAPLYGSVLTLRKVLGAYRVHGQNRWATTSKNWTPQNAVNWLKLNRQLEAIFLDHAQRLGLPVRCPLIHPFQKLEYETLALRFAFDEKVVSQSLLGTLGESLRWFLEVRADKILGRVGRLCWIVFLAIAPKKLIKKILPVARAQSGRSHFWILILGFSRLFDKKPDLPPNKRF